MQQKLFEPESAIKQEKTPVLKNTTGNILSLFDLTGSWSNPYKENGYDVLQVDIQLGINLMTWNYRRYARNYFSGILIAQPCTDFAISGAKNFEEKDSDGTTYESMSLTYKSLAIVQYFKPGLRFWALENPMSRIHTLCTDLGKKKLTIQPYEFAGWLQYPAAEQYQKTTWLWGEFNEPEKKELACLKNGYDKMSEKGGKSIETKNFRSKTPEGFAYAFFLANR